MTAKSKNHFVVGIVDDVTHSSLDVDHDFDIEPDDVKRAMFYGLGFRRHRRRQQELHQDHRRGDRLLRSGLLRLRLQEGRRHHHEPPALRAPEDPFRLPHQEGELHRLPPDQLPRQVRHAGRRGRGFHLPAEHPLRPGRGLEHAAQGSPGRPHLQEDEVLRHRCLRSGQEDRHGRAHQHDHADLLLRHLRRAPPRGGHRPDQEGHQEDLRQEGRRRRPEELPGR